MNAKTVLAVLVTANLILGGLLASRLVARSDGHGTALAKAGPVHEIPGTVQVAPADRAPGATASSRSDKGPSTNTFDWHRVESADYRQYVSNLRAIGCPEETIRDIIKADINKLYEARFNELLTHSTNKFQFWKTGGNLLGNMLDDTLMQKRQEWGEEKRALFKTLMDTEASDSFDLLSSGMNLFKPILDFLPEDKQAQLTAHEARWASKQINSAKAVQDGDVNAMRKLQTEKDADLAAILTPQDKEEYDLRLSQTAMLMRMQMGDFQPTEQEFRDIFKLQKQFEDEYGLMNTGFGKPEEVQKRNAAKRELDKEIKQLLGEERFADYKREQQWNTDPLRFIAKEFNVPKDTAIQVMDIKTVVQEQVQQLRADQNLSVEQRQAALKGIRTETEKTISEIVGSDAAKAYVTRAGKWLPAPAGKKGKGM